MKVAVLCGGLSMERSVSLQSGERVFNALVDLGYQASKFDLSVDDIKDLLAWRPDIVYIALHGKAGEDGSIQEVLDLYEIPYTGPDSLACKLTFDKCLAKQIMESKGILTPDYYSFDEDLIKEIGAGKILFEAASRLGFPLIVKPSKQGSCFGVNLVREEADFPRCAVSAFSYDKRILLERYIRGTEVTVPIVAGKVFPAVEIRPKSEIFDFQAMYQAGETEYFVPARLEEELSGKVGEFAKEVAEIFNAELLCRVDIIIEETSMKPYVIELNTSPGMTATSLLPMSAEALGMGFEKLVEKIIVSSLEIKNR